ncbi:hypothetical protein H6G36_00020 [Anabaena minutissima FACHB-250]|nr:hypothetical protein [Anabaena minutissima FACHB-250]
MLKHEDAVWGENGITRLDNLTGWNGSYTKVPQIARLKIVSIFLKGVLFGERRHNWLGQFSRLGSEVVP